MNSSLVKIDDIQELNFIQSHIKYTYWIGLYQKEDKNEWKWQDNTKLAQQLLKLSEMSEEKVTYSELKLSHAKKKEGKRHLAHKKRENPCTVILGIICAVLLLASIGLGYMYFQKCPKCTTQDMENTKEKNTSSVQLEDHSVVPSEQACGFLQGRHFCCGRNCYYFSEKEETWEESRNLCWNMDSSLVKIDDIQELNFIQSHIKYTYWIGLYKKEDKNEWKWRDNTKLAQQL
uniref:C-type lectin domain-containing protein n=1 Tax=Oryctolagus cuniculus TaxID=9986 RepID=A0A5F9DKM3_RABIT